MILSMTGYGKAKGQYLNRSYSIDIKTLNGKTSELRLKAPGFLRSREIELRKLIQREVIRGKMDVMILCNSSDGDNEYQINTGLIKSYLLQLKEINDQLEGGGTPDYLQTIIRIPNVIQASDEEISDVEWQYLKSLCAEALKGLNAFRLAEGQSLEKDLRNRVDRIVELLEEVPALEEARNNQLKDKFSKLMDATLTKDNIDQNRLEQEIVYYLEKLDIHEEKIRLKQHCKYFGEVLNDPAKSLGKKLNFISQEMGREINTLGSKAQFSLLQKIVVQMKVELDQIKEQLANIL